MHTPEGEDSTSDTENTLSLPVDTSDTSTVVDNDDSLNLDVPSDYKVEPAKNPAALKLMPGIILPREILQQSEDKSLYETEVLSNLQDVRLERKNVAHRRIIPASSELYDITITDDLKTEADSSLDDSFLSEDRSDAELDLVLESVMEKETSVSSRLNNLISETVNNIEELTAEEEAEDIREARNWKIVFLNGIEHRIDLRVLEPYKRVVSHGGYMLQGSRNAIIIFSSCFLPDRSRTDYDYVMSNLFLYVISTLDELVTDDYVLIYLHGGSTRSSMPKFSWLKKCYQMIDRKLKKNLKGLYLVHPTFWLKTLVIMTRPFISSKFIRKLHFIYSLNELYRKLPVEKASIPDRVKHFDAISQL